MNLDLAGSTGHPRKKSVTYKITSQKNIICKTIHYLDTLALKNVTYVLNEKQTSMIIKVERVYSPLKCPFCLKKSSAAALKISHTLLAQHAHSTTTPGGVHHIMENEQHEQESTSMRRIYCDLPTMEYMSMTTLSCLMT